MVHGAWITVTMAHVRPCIIGDLRDGGTMDWFILFLCSDMINAAAALFLL
jgi:hypothetical protein